MSYRAHSILKSIVTEHILEHTISYRAYLTEHIEQNISYRPYLTERILQNMSYSAYICNLQRPH